MKIRNPGDWAVALAVIVSSIVLFGALAVALTGTFVGRPGVTLYADFPDVTGVGVDAPVKIAGASAGWVTQIRILSAAERKQSDDPANAVRVRMTLNKGVPLPGADVRATVASDTLLSEKFILLDGGSASAPPVKEHAVIAGVPPTTFDQLVRNADTTLSAVNTLIGGGMTQPAGDIFLQIRLLIGRADSLLAEVSPLLKNLGVTVDEARGLIGDNREPLTRAVAGLEGTSREFGALAADGRQLLAKKRDAISSAMDDLRVTTQNAKLATTYARVLALRLAQNPSQLVWGRKALPALPSEGEILKASKPIPLSD